MSISEAELEHGELKDCYNLFYVYE